MQIWRRTEVAAPGEEESEAFLDSFFSSTEGPADPGYGVFEWEVW